MVIKKINASSLSASAVSATSSPLFCFERVAAAACNRSSYDRKKWVDDDKEERIEDYPRENNDGFFTLPQLFIEFSGEFLDFKVIEAKSYKQTLNINLVVLKRGGGSKRRGFYGQFKIKGENQDNYARVCVTTPSNSSKPYEQYYIKPFDTTEVVFDFINFLRVDDMANLERGGTTTTTKRRMVTRQSENRAQIIIYSCVGTINERRVNYDNTTFMPANFSRVSNTMVYGVNIIFTEDCLYFHELEENVNVTSDGIVDDVLALYLGIYTKKRKYNVKK